MLRMANYEKVLSRLWFDNFTSYRSVKTKDPITGETSTTTMPIITNRKCRISFPTTDEPTQGNDTANIINNNIEIITFYKADVITGDQVEAVRVDRDGVTPLATYKGIVGEANIYRGHKEILLSNVKVSEEDS